MYHTIYLYHMPARARVNLVAAAAVAVVIAVVITVAVVIWHVLRRRSPPPATEHLTDFLIYERLRERMLQPTATCRRREQRSDEAEATGPLCGMGVRVSDSCVAMRTLETGDSDEAVRLCSFPGPQSGACLAQRRPW